MSELCIVMFSREKMCGLARVQLGVVSTPPSRSWQLLLSGREAARFSNFCRRTNGTKLNIQSELTGWHWHGGISRLRMLFRAAIGAWVRCCRISPLVWPFVVLPFLRVPFLPILSPWRRTPPCWAWWPAWRMMVVGVNSCRSPRYRSPASLTHWPTVLLNERRWRLWLSVHDAQVWSAPCNCCRHLWIVPSSCLTNFWIGLRMSSHVSGVSVDKCFLPLVTRGLTGSTRRNRDILKYREQARFVCVFLSSCTIIFVGGRHRSKCSRNSFASAQKKCKQYTVRAHVFSCGQESCVCCQSFLSSCSHHRNSFTHTRGSRA